MTPFLFADLVPDGVVDMRGLLMQVVQNSSHGWDYVLEGIVQFGFSLMEGYSPRSVTSAVPFGDLGTVDRLVCATGAGVVLRTYEVRAMTNKAAYTASLGLLLVSLLCCDCVSKATVVSPVSTLVFPSGASFVV